MFVLYLLASIILHFLFFILHYSFFFHIFLLALFLLHYFPSLIWLFCHIFWQLSFFFFSLFIYLPFVYLSPVTKYLLSGYWKKVLFLFFLFSFINDFDKVNFQASLSDFYLAIFLNKYFYLPQVYISLRFNIILQG